MRAFIALLLTLSPLSLMAISWVPGEKYVSKLIEEYHQGSWQAPLQEIEEAFFSAQQNPSNRVVHRSQQTVEQNASLYNELSQWFDHTMRIYTEEAYRILAKRNARYQILQRENPSSSIHALITDYLKKEEQRQSPFASVETYLSDQSYFISFWPPLFDEENTEKKEKISQLLSLNRGKMALLRFPSNNPEKERSFREIAHILRIDLWEKIQALYPDQKSRMHSAAEQAYRFAQWDMAAEWDFYFIKKAATEGETDYERTIGQLFFETQNEIDQTYRNFQTALQQERQTLVKS